MKTIIVNNQVGWDALPTSFDELTCIELRGSDDKWIVIAKHIENTHVVARGNTHVEARGNTHVEAWENTHVVARGNTHVEAWGNTHVEAWENTHVEARGNTRVVAWGNTRVVAWGNTHVEARGNTHVVAWGNTHVVAWGTSMIHAQSQFNTLEIGAFAVVMLLAKVAKLTKRSRTCTVINAQNSKPKTTISWARWNGAKLRGSKLTLFKRVSKELKTQEGTANETTWEVGDSLTVPDWNPAEECGEGKFHACFCPSACDEYRSLIGDRYVAVEVLVKDAHFFKDGGQHPNKLAFRRGKVLYECDRFGKKI